MNRIRVSRRTVVKGSAAAGIGLIPSRLASGAAAQDDNVTATVMRGEHPSQPIINDAPAHLAITDNTGVNLDFQPVPSTDWDTKRQTLLATNQAPDLMYVNNIEQVRDFLGDAVLLPLDELIADNAPNVERYLASNPQFQTLRFDGSMYTVPGLYFNWRRLAPMPMIRMDILDDAGLSAPTTLDELFTVIGEMKAAAPGSVGWTNRNNAIHLLGLVAYPLGSGMAGGNGIYFDEEVNGGQWVFGPTKPAFLDALDYLRRAYSEGILDPEFSVTPADGWQTKNSSGQGLFTWDNMSFGLNWNSAIRSENPDSEGWQPLETLAGPLGPRQRDYDFIREGWAIGSNAEDPAALVRMIDWMLTPEGIDITNWGIEGEHFTRNQPLPESIEDYSAEGLTQAMPSERNSLLPEVYDRFAANSDPFRSFQSETGTGLLDFAFAFDDTITYLWSQTDDLDAWYELTSNDPGLRKPVPTPSFTPEEAEELQTLNREINELLEPAYDQVIIGQISLDDYAEVASVAEDMGASRIEEIYNTAQSRL